MKILIIGSNGLIGSNITKCLLRKKEWLIYPLIRSKKRFGSFDNTKNSHVLELNDFYEIEDFVSLIIKYDINLISEMLTPAYPGALIGSLLTIITIIALNYCWSRFSSIV